MDEYVNCLLSICCPPLRSQEVFTKLLVLDGLDEAAAAKAASCVLKHFDLAPKDTMQPLIQEVARLARGKDYQG